jgi:hypothetical protein
MTDSPREHDLRTETGCDACGEPAKDRCPHCQSLTCGNCATCEHGNGQQPAQPDYDPLASKDHSEALAALTQPTFHSKSEAKRVTAMQAQPGSGEAVGRPISFTYNDGSGPGKEGWWSCVRELDPSDSPVVPMAAYDRLQSALTAAKADAEHWKQQAKVFAKAADNERNALTAAQQRIAALEGELENERARDIHTCHDQCERPLCVAQRRIRELEHQLAVRSVS